MDWTDQKHRKEEGGMGQIFHPIPSYKKPIRASFQRELYPRLFASQHEDFFLLL